MIRDKSLLQKRDPNSQECADAKQEGPKKFAELNKALQGYPKSDELDMVRKFQAAMYQANAQQDDPHYQKIKEAYGPVATAFANPKDEQARKVSVAATNMMNTVDRIQSLCKAYV